MRRNGKDYPLEIKEILRTVQDSLIFTVTVKGNEILAERRFDLVKPGRNLIDYAANHPHQESQSTSGYKGGFTTGQEFLL